MSSRPLTVIVSTSSWTIALQIVVALAMRARLILSRSEPW
jgi:hypothetical protein